MIKNIYEMTNEEIHEYINNHLSIRKREKDKYENKTKTGKVR